MSGVWIQPTKKAEVESSRTSLASRTHFEVLGLGLGLEALSLRKLPCSRFEDNTIFWTVKILLENVKNLVEKLRRPFVVFLNWRLPEKIFLKTFHRLKKILRTFFCWRSPKKNFKDLFFREHLRLCLFGLERVYPRKGCPWPRIFLCPCPWPRALCPRLHLCKKVLDSVGQSENHNITPYTWKIKI